MDNSLMLELWNDMWKEGNWVPSWPDTLTGVSAELAAWKPSNEPDARSVWEETAHVTYWRNVTITRIEDADAPTEEESALNQFKIPEELTEENWQDSLSALKTTQDTLAVMIADGTKDLHRIHYHLIHDAYHLGRIITVLALKGRSPKF